MVTAAKQKAAAAAKAPGPADSAPATDATGAEVLQAASEAAPSEPDKPLKTPTGAVVSVTTVKGIGRFFRCGMRFGPEPVELAVAELGEGVLERLKNEPRIVVSEGS